MFASPNTAPPSVLTPELYRNVMGCFPTGVTVMTTHGLDGGRIGVTASSFNTVSIDPPLVLWSLALRAPSLSAFREATHFGINVLAADQADVAMQFSRASTDKFNRIDTKSGVTGVPLIAGALAHIECRILQRHPGGDHEIILGEVEHMKSVSGEPLVFRGGRFCRIAHD